MELMCHRCGHPMVIRKTIVFATGPLKLIFECSACANHVRVMEDRRKCERPTILDQGLSSVNVP